MDWRSLVRVGRTWRFDCTYTVNTYSILAHEARGKRWGQYFKWGHFFEWDAYLSLFPANTHCNSKRECTCICDKKHIQICVWPLLLLFCMSGDVLLLWGGMGALFDGSLCYRCKEVLAVRKTLF